MTKKYRKLIRDSTGMLVGMNVMGALSSNLPAQAQPAVNSAYGAMGIASTGLMLNAASGLMRDVRTLGMKRRRRRR